MSDDVSSRRLDIGSIVAIMLFAMVGLSCAWVIWKFYSEPLQPMHPVMAKVVAIAPTSGRSTRQFIMVRNAHAVGSISVAIGENRCSVGDVILVNQRGTTLSGLRSTCR